MFFVLTTEFLIAIVKRSCFSCGNGRIALPVISNRVTTVTGSPAGGGGDRGDGGGTGGGGKGLGGGEGWRGGGGGKAGCCGGGGGDGALGGGGERSGVLNSTVSTGLYPSPSLASCRWDPTWVQSRLKLDSRDSRETQERERERERERGTIKGSLARMSDARREHSGARRRWRHLLPQHEPRKR